MTDTGVTCVRCGAHSPPTETNYTLISPSHGWRCIRRLDDEGNRVLEWFCPSCWAKQRDKNPASVKPKPR